VLLVIEYIKDARSYKRKKMYILVYTVFCIVCTVFCTVCAVFLYCFVYVYLFLFVFSVLV